MVSKVILCLFETHSCFLVDWISGNHLLVGLRSSLPIFLLHLIARLGEVSGDSGLIGGLKADGVLFGALFAFKMLA